MVVRELVGGNPSYVCKVIYVDDPAGFGQRVEDGDRVLEHLLVKPSDFERTMAELTAAGFAETECSLSRRVFVSPDRFWIVSLDGDTLRTQFGTRRADWRESSGKAKGKEFRDRARAVAAYHSAIVEKRAEGYSELYGRDVPLAAPKAVKKPGKKKSR